MPVKLHLGSETAHQRVWSNFRLWLVSVPREDEALPRPGCALSHVSAVPCEHDPLLLCDRLWSVKLLPACASGHRGPYSTGFLGLLLPPECC